MFFRGTTHTSHVWKTSRQPVFMGALLHFIPVWGCSSKELHMWWCGVATGTNYCGQSRGLGSQVLGTSYFSFLCCSFTSSLPAVGAETNGYLTAGRSAETLPMSRQEHMKNQVLQMITPLTCPIWVSAAVERLLGAPFLAHAPPSLPQLSEQLCY